MIPPPFPIQHHPHHHHFPSSPPGPPTHPHTHPFFLQPEFPDPINSECTGPPWLPDPALLDTTEAAFLIRHAGGKAEASK